MVENVTRRSGAIGKNLIREPDAHPCAIPHCQKRKGRRFPTDAVTFNDATFTNYLSCQCSTTGVFCSDLTVKQRTNENIPRRAIYFVLYLEVGKSRSRLHTGHC